MTPWPSWASDGVCTGFKKLRGMPVVRLMRGLLSNSLSLFVGQSWIQWPENKEHHDRYKQIREHPKNLFDHNDSIRN